MAVSEYQKKREKAAAKLAGWYRRFGEVCWPRLRNKQCKMSLVVRAPKGSEEYLEGVKERYGGTLVKERCLHLRSYGAIWGFVTDILPYAFERRAELQLVLEWIEDRSHRRRSPFRSGEAALI